MRSLMLIGLFFYCSISYAVEGKPHIRRICLDRVTGEVTILWNRPSDICGSFKNFRIYGREDASSSFGLVVTITNFNVNSYNYILPNLKNWEFFIVYNTACNGIDSICSDTVIVDSKEPAIMDLDSVSVDPVTQKTLIGWESNPDVDTKGYFVYYVTATNQSVGDTNKTTYRDYKSGNPGAGPVKYAVAAYDSCGNTSPIGSSHTTVYLTANTDICNKQITLSWTAYIGWTSVSSYDVFVNKNAGGYQLVASVPAASLSYNYSFSTFGDSYCFFIRAHKTASPFTSSSNTVCKNTNAIKNPTVNYIARVTVSGKIIEVTALFDNASSAQTLYLERSVNGGAFSVISTYNAPLPNSIFYQDNNVDVQKNIYAYHLVSEGPCNLKLTTSNTSNSILLNLDASNQPNNQLSWNNYDVWLEGTEKYVLLYGDADYFGGGSTWNTAGTFPVNPGSTIDNRPLVDLQKPICYCILAVEPRVNVLNRKDSSYSNITCLNGDPIVYFPDAFQVNGFNNTFSPKGAYIDYTKSTYAIYNRWGEKVFATKTIDVPWDGKDTLGNPCEQDVYVYSGTIIGLNGKQVLVSGTVTLLK